ncbi:MAG TPA: RecX family transcriptional regulator [Anaeromyxobacter sp.]|nr:RecX family transcriptional regulator [Anaeromyxobacter sp.]
MPGPRSRTRRAAAQEQPPPQRARALALRLLALRARTEAQIRARLEREELGAHADEVVEWLRGLGYLDDGAYAAARARTLLGRGGLGPRKAEQKLVQAGLPPAAARAAVRAALAGEEGTPPGDAERALCRALAERRARRPLAELDARGRARLGRFLAGRGFGGAAIGAVLGIWTDGEG